MAERNLCELFHNYDFDSDAHFQAGMGHLLSTIPDQDKAERLLQAKLFYYSKFHGKLTLEEYQNWLELNKRLVDHPTGQGHACKSTWDTTDPALGTTAAKKEAANPKTALDSTHSGDNSTVTHQTLTQTVSSSNQSSVPKDSTDSLQEMSPNTTQPSKTERKASGEPKPTGEALAASNTTVSLEQSGDNNQTGEVQSASEDNEYSLNELMEMLAAGKLIPGIQNLDIEATNTEPTRSTQEPVRKPWQS